ncbi:MAG: hypothetical protein M1827_002767 [Pycnora praestabilis]|nr:MAG: hypothetical protein M1827_002767 [Pycnora praestabilis]
MAAPSVPTIPPRPARSQNQQAVSAQAMDIPPIPPRPANRKADRSQSPHRSSFARSPLNEMTFGQSNGSELFSRSHNDSNSNLPQRPPSVSLPSIGQEGNEYAGFAYEEPTADLHPDQSSETQTRNIGSDLKLHAPKPSLPTSSATARVATVTRTDSTQAAAAGYGRPPSQAEGKNTPSQSLKSRTSFVRSGSSASTERPDSALLAEGEVGIPEIGQRVPMYPNAGDVQAPSPSPFSQAFHTGIGFHNDGSQKPGRHHPRTRSGRDSLPPGSYGLHGHGVPSQDRFEKAWYDKHPDALLREEHGEYGPGIGGGRGEWALSSDDLNKIVRDTASRGLGFGTSPNVIGTPNEQIGYLASEEYALRMASRPQSASQHHTAHSQSSQTHAESPLRKASFPVDVTGKEDFENSKDNSKRRPSEFALESETEDDDVVHVNPPSRRGGKIGGGGYDPPTEDLGPHGGNTNEEGGYVDERGYGVPILASDEVAKEEDGAEYLQPAVSPAQERRGSTYFAGVDSDAPPSYQTGHWKTGSRGSSVAGSRPASRPGSIHGHMPNLSKWIPHEDREELGTRTPLEDVEEYEPLFPDEENPAEANGRNARPMTAADKLKRPDLFKRKFPSQDIWEDTPSSLQLQATVSTPELPEDDQVASAAPEMSEDSKLFESPEMEAARKGEYNEDDRASFLPKESRAMAKTHFKPHLRDDMSSRPGMRHRFPSRDIWEDTPDSLRLETTVMTPEMDEMRSPPDARPTTGAVAFSQEKAASGRDMGDGEGRATTGISATLDKPSIPPRPVKAKPTEGVNGAAAPPQPTIPSRPPQRLRQVPPAEIPPPPTKPSEENQQQTRNVPPAFLPPSKSEEETSPISERKVPLLPDRPKPQVPARPTKHIMRDPAEDIPLSKTTSATSATSAGSADDESSTKGLMSPPAPKPKPAIPSRPAGGKIASLKAGFLSDLDKRLQLGPQAPKPHERNEELEKKEEKAPLNDARKGRARGPARRKPVAPATGIPEEPSTKDASNFGISIPWTVWEISEDGNVDVASETKTIESPSISPAKVAHDSTSTLATNTAGQALLNPEEIAPVASKAAHPQDSLHDIHSQQGLKAQKLDLLNRVSNQGDARPKASEDPPITGETRSAQQIPPDAAPVVEAGDEEVEDPAFIAAKTANVAKPQTSTPRAVAAADETLHTGRSAPSTTSEAVQTGEQVINTNTSSEDPSEKLIAYTGGAAPDEGNVVIKESTDAMDQWRSP